MTNTPFILNGTLTDIDGSTGLASAKLVAMHVTDDSTTFTASDASGLYAFDLANFTSGVSVGDVVKVKAVKSTKIRVVNITITQAMIDTGGYVYDFTIYGLRQHVFKTFQSLYDDNKPPALVKDDASSAWTVLSAFPESNPSFPCIVVNPSNVTGRFITFDSSQIDDNIDVEVEFFGEAKYGKAGVDKGRDYIGNVLKDNESTLLFAGVEFMNPDWLDDSNISDFTFNDSKYNFANQIVRLNWIG